MEGLDAIRDRILEEARAKADGIVAQARRQAADRLAGEADQIAQERQEQADQMAIQERLNQAHTLSLAAVERRKKLLLARRAMIDDAIRLAAERLQNLPDAEKLAWYRQLLQRSTLMQGEVILPRRDRHLAHDLLRDSKLAEAGRAYQLSTREGDFAAGLVIRQELIEDNQTLEWQLKQRQTELVQLAATQLFPPETDMGVQQT